MNSAPSSLVQRVSNGVVGRQREIELLLAALAAGRHIVLEGPPGTGKSTLLRVVANELGCGFQFVEGNAELTPSRLAGHFDPSVVIAQGYRQEAFIPGPLATAMADGSLLYIEELNRVPEETLNVLITVMSEGELNVPRAERIVAAPGFRIVAAMNPFDATGTARISGAIYDRVCRLAVSYQDAADEAQIVRDSRVAPGADDAWLAKVVQVVRATRSHADVRVGSSVRGAIDIAAVAAELAAIRDGDATDPMLGLDAAIVALSGRMRLRDGALRTAEDIVGELWWSVFQRDEADDAGKAIAPTGATAPRSADLNPGPSKAARSTTP